MPVLAALEPLAPQDPRSVGAFRLRARLGSGGMGQVYLGYSPAGRPVAVKVVHPELARDQQFRKRFRREVAAARKVNAAYTAPVIAAGPDDEIPWLATAYVAGPSVADTVAVAGPLPPKAVLRLGGGLGEALAEIHATDVVHRDLKPSNVLLVADGPRVIDFGISRAIENSALTTTGLVIGTPGFMAPEQATGDEAGPASDVFSLGVVLAFAATGRDPFGAGSPVSVLFRVVHAEPDLEGINGPLRDLISSCMAKDPAARPAAGEIAALAGVSDLADRIGAGRNAGTFWPSGLDELIRRYAERADEMPPSGPGAANSGLAASAGPWSPETETVRPLTGAGGPTDPSGEDMSGGRGGVPGGPLPGAASPPAPEQQRRIRRPLLRRGVLAALLAVLVAAGVTAAIELPGGPKSGPVALPGASASHAPTTSPAAASPVPSASSPGLQPTSSSSGNAGDTATSSTQASQPPVQANPAPPSVSASAPVSSVSAPPQRTYPVPVLLGAPNWNGYCEANGEGPVTLVAADYAYGWHCTNATSLGDDANAVCAWTFNRPADQTTNNVTNFYDANSWQCWSATTEISAPDWNGYCEAQGLGTVVQKQNNAYGWYCTKSGNGLDAGTACAWTNGASTQVIARFQDFYDPDTWQCWV